MRKLLTLALSILMVLTLIPVAGISAFAEDTNFIYEDYGEFIAIAGYNGTVPENLVIPSEINGLPVEEIEYDAFYECDELKSVVIPNSVTYIGAYAFSMCTNLTSVTFSKNLQIIEDSAFYGSDLTSITVPDSVYSLGDMVFADCADLSKIKLPAGLDYIGEDILFGTAYYNNKANWENNALYVDNYLISTGHYYLDDEIFDYVYDWRVSGDFKIKEGTKRIVEYAFWGNEEITSVTIPSSVDMIPDGTFGYCTALKYVTIPDTVSHIGSDAFTDCTSLKSITIPESITSIEDMAFYNCTALETIKLPNTIEYIGCDSFYNTAFFNNKANWDKDNVLYLDKYLIGGVHFEYGDDGTIFNHGVSGDYTVKSGTKVIAEYAFWECDDLTSITIPSSLKEIAYGAFSCCDKLASVSLPNSIEMIGVDAFYDCPSLTAITIPASVEVISDCAFLDCFNLKEITILNKDVYISDEAIGYYYNLDDEGYWQTTVEGLVIKGYKDSTAEEYALDNGFEFSEIQSKLGDCNMDGSVNGKDVLVLRKHIVGFQVNIDLSAADCTGDGNINGKDVLQLRKAIIGLVTL